MTEEKEVDTAEEKEVDTAERYLSGEKVPQEEQSSEQEDYIVSVKEFYTKKLKKQARIFTYSLVAASILIVCLAFIITLRKGPLPQTIEKEVIVEREVVKYIEEKGQTPTSKFITYLNSRIDPVVSEAIAKAIDKSSKKYSLPRKLVLSIMNKESFFNPLAKSHKDCVGLMQVNPKEHKEKIKDIPPTHLYHIDVNVDMGCRIFREYFDEHEGDLDKTFHAYLSMRASQSEKNEYKGDILYTFALLEMYKYSVIETVKSEPEKVQEIPVPTTEETPH